MASNRDKKRARDLMKANPGLTHTKALRQIQAADAAQGSLEELQRQLAESGTSPATPDSVRRVVVGAVRDRLGPTGWPAEAVLDVTIEAGGIVVHVNSGGNAIAARQALARQGYEVDTVAVEQPDYGVRIHIKPYPFDEAWTSRLPSKEQIDALLFGQRDAVHESQETEDVLRDLGINPTSEMIERFAGMPRGFALPSGSPVFVDSSAFVESGITPHEMVVGAPGSGKTRFQQMSWWGPITNTNIVTALRGSGEDTRLDFLGGTVIGRWSFVGTGQHDVGVLNENGDLVEQLPHVKRHSPGGFGWGYEGSGAADLALSILTYVLGSYDPLESHDGTSPLPLAVYQSFKQEVVAKMPSEGGWTLTLREVESWVHRQRITVQPERREDLSLPLAYHLYPGGVVGQQDLHRCDPWLVVGFGDHEHVELFWEEFQGNPEAAVGQRLVARDDDPDGTLAAYSTPIGGVDVSRR